MLPEHQQDNRRPILRAFGYMCRVALALLCTYALASFTFSCLGIDIGGGVVFLLSAAVCLVLGVMFYDRRLLIGGSVVIFAAMLFAAHSYGGVFETLYLIGACIYNVWCRRLLLNGYHGAEEDLIDISERLTEAGVDEASVMHLAVLLIVLIFGIVGAVSTVRRARVVPFFGISVVLSVLMISFGACEGATGIMLMLAALCAVFALSAYDSVYCSRKHIRAQLGTDSNSPDSRREIDHIVRVNSSLGGFVGICAALIALVLLIVPIQISKPMKDIPSVSNTAVKAENFFSALLRTSGGGASSVIFGEDVASRGRESMAQRRIFSGKRIFEVHSDVNMPIYLRSWVGTDYAEDSWYTVSDEKVEEYRELFGSGFSHEYLTAELLRAIDPSLVAPPDTSARLAYHSPLGYVSAYVHIDKKAPSESLLYMPSYTDQKTRLLAYGSRTDTLARGYSNYYDGIFSSADYVLVDDYTVLAHLQMLPNESTALGIASLIEEYADQYEKLRELRGIIASGADEDDVRGIYDALCADESVDVGSLAYRYAYEMDSTARRDVNALMDNLPLYYNYVYDNYLSGCENFASFEGLVKEICGASDEELRKKAQSYTGRHEITAAIIDYLGENMTYTLTPSAPSGNRRYVNAADTFLFDTKEGYCVQYASAVVMLLRAAGIPARYAEGYVAYGFRGAPDNDIAKFETTVRDSNAHAWVEVYYDYYGWVTYEATSSYVIGAVDNTPSDTGETDGSTADTLPQEVTDTTGTEPAIPTDITAFSADTTTGERSEKSGGEADRSAAFVGVIITVILTAFVAILVLIVVHRGRSADKKRREIMSFAGKGRVGEAHRCDVARYIGDEIMRLLKRVGFVPKTGERASAFANRVDSALGTLDGHTFADVMRALQAAEFAKEASGEDLAKMAEYYTALYDAVLEKSGFMTRLYIKYSEILRK